MSNALTIIRRPVKHARLRVRDDGTVQLIAPESFEQALIDDLLERKAGWIARQQKFFERRVTNVSHGLNEIVLFGDAFLFKREPQLGRRVVVDTQNRSIKSGRDLTKEEQQVRWYRHYARAVLRERTRELSAVHRIPFNRLFIRSQETKWGSCSTRRNVSLNWRLILAPDYVINYVILHELAHTLVLNHTHRFWVLLKSLCPERDKAVDWLTANPPPRNPGVRSRTGT